MHRIFSVHMDVKHSSHYEQKASSIGVHMVSHSEVLVMLLLKTTALVQQVCSSITTKEMQFTNVNGR